MEQLSVASEQFRDVARKHAQAIITLHDRYEQHCRDLDVGDPHDPRWIAVDSAYKTVSTALQHLANTINNLGEDYEHDNKIPRPSANAKVAQRMLTALPSVPELRELDVAVQHLQFHGISTNTLHSSSDAVAAAQYILAATDEDWSEPRCWSTVRPYALFLVAQTLGWASPE